MAIVLGVMGLAVPLRVVLRALVPHTLARLGQQNAAPLGQHRGARQREHLVCMGGQAVPHPIPLPEIHHDQPPEWLLTRDSGQALGQRPRDFPLHMETDIRLTDAEGCQIGTRGQF